MTVKSKRCPTCGKTKPAADFYPSLKEAGGLDWRCKPCKSDNSKASWRKYYDKKKAAKIATVKPIVVYQPAVLVLQELSRIANGETGMDSACPSDAKIGQRVGVTRDQVRTAIKKLVASGDIKKEFKPGGLRRIELLRAGKSTGWTAYTKIDHGRHVVQLDPDTPWTTRQCLTCRKEFESWGPGNRLCPTHRNSAAREDAHFEESYRVAT